MTARHPRPDLTPASGNPDRSTAAGTPAPGDRHARRAWRRLRRHLGRLRVLPALVGVAVVAAACSSPAATSTPTTTPSPPHNRDHHRGTGIVGKVVAVSASSLAVDVRAATRTITLTPTTRYRQGPQDVAASTLTPGARVRVRTAANGSAAVVAILPATASGTIVALDTHGFTLHTSHGTTLAVTLEASTTYHDGTRTMTGIALEPGQKLHIQGQPGPNGSFTATKITIAVGLSG